MNKILVQKGKNGYLLIELMVSLAIFSLIMTTSIGAMLAIIEANAKSQTVKSVMDNVNVAVENMSRTIRIGTDYQCISDHNTLIVDQTTCGAGAAGISFLPQDSAGPSDYEEYYFNSGAIWRYRATLSNGNPVQLTAPEVKIDIARFYLSGLDTNDGQPRVFMAINGTAGPDNTNRQSKFALQTSVTQRQPDSNELAVGTVPVQGGSPNSGLVQGATYSLDFDNGENTTFTLTSFDGTNFSGTGSFDDISLAQDYSISGTVSGSTMSFVVTYTDGNTGNQLSTPTDPSDPCYTQQNSSGGQLCPANNSSGFYQGTVDQSVGGSGRFNWIIQPK